MFFELLAVGAALGASWFGYSTARRFVRERLRYVEAAHTPFAAIAAGVVAALIAMPLTAILPIVGAGTAIAFGLSTALGTRAGASDVKRGYRITDGL